MTITAGMMVNSILGSNLIKSGQKASSKKLQPFTCIQFVPRGVDLQCDGMQRWERSVWADFVRGRALGWTLKEQQNLNRLKQELWIEGQHEQRYQEKDQEGNIWEESTTGLYMK